jgi:hypothetical protein
MIEGLRQAPWFDLTTRRDSLSVALYLDCDECKRRRTTETRQLLGCPYLPPMPRAPVPRPPGWSDARVWVHPGMLDLLPLDENGMTRDLPKDCVGYTTKLPGVIERKWQLHWLEKGGFGMLVSELGGEPTDEDLEALKILESMKSAAAAWAIDNPPEKKDAS